MRLLGLFIPKILTVLFVCTVPLMSLAQPAGWSRVYCDWTLYQDAGTIWPAPVPIVDGHGNVYVHEYKGFIELTPPYNIDWKHQVSKYSADGVYVSSFGKADDETIPEYFLQMEIGKADNFYLWITDENGYFISLRDPNGKKIKGFAHGGTTADSLIHDIFSNFTFDKDMNLVIPDKGDNSIKIFSPDGKYLRKYVKPGITDGKAFGPSGIDYDRVNHRYYLLDLAYKRVLVYDDNFTLLRILTRTDNWFDGNLRIIKVNPITHELWTNNAGNTIKILDTLGQDKSTFKDTSPEVNSAPQAFTFNEKGVLAGTFSNTEWLYIYTPESTTTGINDAIHKEGAVTVYSPEPGLIQIREVSGKKIKEVNLFTVTGQSETFTSETIRTGFRGFIIVNTLFEDGSSNRTKLFLK